MTEKIDDRRKYLQGQPAHMTVSQQFRLLLNMLKKDFPPEHPIKVRRVNKESLSSDTPLFGTCSLVNQNKPKAKRYFVITLCKTNPWSVQTDTLLHEWAHALTWYQLVDGKDHGDVFARKYGVLYREYIED